MLEEPFKPLRPQAKFFASATNGIVLIKIMVLKYKDRSLFLMVSLLLFS